MKSNLIYITLFHQQSYIQLLKLLITSIEEKGNVNHDTTDILILTSPLLQPFVEKKMHGVKLPIQYYLLDFNTLMEASSARLYIFNYANIQQYKKILYLDTDILINSDLNVLFNLSIDSDKLYVLEEGNIEGHGWGGQFFDFTKYSKNQSAFTAGIQLYENTEKISSLYNEVQDHIYNYISIKGNPIQPCLEQPFLVYQAVTSKKYNNQLLKKYVENNPKYVNKEKIIYHFPGPSIGDGSSKYNIMLKFWNSINEITPTLIQHSNVPIESSITDKITLKLDKIWDYKIYTTDEMIQYFLKNPINDLPDIVKKFNAILSNLHKTYLFRYYYLYTNGGIFMDTNIMIFKSIHDIAKNYNFISVNSSSNPKTIFQGILGSAPKNQIIKKALYNAYNTEPAILQTDSLYWCRDLYNIILNDTNEYNMKLYREVKKENHSEILDDENNIIFEYYWKTNIVPKISLNTLPFVNKRYLYDNTIIKFLENGKLYGDGTYSQLDNFTFQINFKNKDHIFVFNNDYTEFNSIQKGSSNVIKGNIMLNESLINNKYSWNNSTILFLENGNTKGHGIGDGIYKQISKFIIDVSFGNREHILVFDNSYQYFVSVRKNDHDIVRGQLL